MRCRACLGKAGCGFGKSVTISTWGNARRLAASSFCVEKSVEKRMLRQVVCCGFVLLAASGCLSGSYDEDFERSVQRYRQDGEFQQLHREPKSLAGNRLLIRVPKLFKSEDETGEKRSKPPFVSDFPGFCVAYEVLIAADGKEFPAGLSVGVPIDQESGLEELKKKILAQVQKEPAFAKAAWTAVNDLPPADGSVAWSVLKLEGQQPFECINNAVTEPLNTQGETQIWLASDPNTKVAAVLAWRVPQEIATNFPLNELAGLVARTVEFKAQAEAPAPAAQDGAPAAAQ
jgi:hypothetical protein